MCPIVPTFTCGFDRSNFSLPIAVHPLFGRRVPAIQNKTRSVIRIQLQKLCPQFRRDLLQAGEVELADLALVAVAEAVVLGRSRPRPAMPLRRTSSKSRMRSPARSTDLRKSSTLAGGEAVSMADRTAPKACGIGHRNHCLLMQSAQHITPTSRTKPRHSRLRL